MRIKYFVRNLLLNFVIFFQLLFLPLPIQSFEIFAGSDLGYLPGEIEDFRQAYFEKNEYDGSFGFTYDEQSGQLSTPQECQKDQLNKIDYEVGDNNRDPEGVAKVIQSTAYFSNMIAGMTLVSMAMGIPVRCKAFFKSPMLTLMVTSALTYLLNHFIETKNQLRSNTLAQQRLMPLGLEQGVALGELRTISNQVNLIKTLHTEIKILKSRSIASAAIAAQIGGALAFALWGNGIWIASKSGTPGLSQTAQATHTAIDGFCKPKTPKNPSSKIQKAVGEVLVGMYESIPSCIDKFGREGTDDFLKKFNQCSNILKDVLFSMVARDALKGKSGGNFGAILDAVKGAQQVYQAGKQKTSFHGYNRLIQKLTMKTFLIVNEKDAQSGASQWMAETKTYIRAIILLGSALAIFSANAANAAIQLKKAKQKFKVHKCEFERLWALAKTSNPSCPGCPPTGLAMSGENQAQNMQSQLANYRRQVQELEDGMDLDKFQLCMDQDYSMSSSCQDPGEFKNMTSSHVAFPSLGSFYNDAMGYANALNNNDFGAAQKFQSRLSGHKSAINARIAEGKKKLNERMRKSGKKEFDIDKEIAKHVDEMRSAIQQSPGMQDLQKTLDNKQEILSKLQKQKEKQQKGSKESGEITKYSSPEKNQGLSGEGTDDTFSDFGDYEDENENEETAQPESTDTNSLNNYEFSHQSIHDKPETSLFEIVHTRYLLNYDKVLKKKSEQPLAEPKSAKETDK